ncbi:MAG TPA: hypothetical protein VH418_13085 [Solirubrobacteraceae bacterium]
METTYARALAERLHSGDREPDGTPLLWHIRRVAGATPREGQAIAWLHEALENGAISEQALLEDGLGSEELRALRLLSRSRASSSDRAYLAHLELIAHAAGYAGELARMVKIADLEDRRRHPLVREGGWSPPYGRGLARLLEAAPRHRAVAS